ncbi:MAG: tRNA (N(6)-L-threonylcarbamoyladenosine(37)-C(2))-methylthiotransferase [Candidatus Micrarchaeota archaeon]|nr:tRNA (N(6)-L-threonylcarbamoyladenosine(37)-C(2))-methylthiotransferase [Candidatus Micrarchaeota archaeon]
MRYYLETYGCTLNRADSDAIRAVMKGEGAEEVREEGEADVIIINTCTVKDATEKRIVNRIKRIGKPLVVAGCLGAANPKLVRAAAPHACMVDPSSVSKIYDAVKSAIEGKRREYTNDKNEKSKLPRCGEGHVARVPIAEGCVGSCSFCQTRLARGRLVSYPAEDVVGMVREAVGRGAGEVQMTAQDSAAYGIDLCGKPMLSELMAKVNGVGGDFLVRVGMMNPEHALRDRELAEAFKLPKFYKFAHIPVQSGSDGILKSMKRGHSAADFAGLVGRLRAKIPEITIATDVIVGFPGEKEEDFERTVTLIEKVKPDIVNVSKYSARPGTGAALMAKTGGVARGIVNERSGRMSEVCRRIALGRNRALVGREYEVRITELTSGGAVGRNINYKPVVVEDGHIGKKTWVRIVGAGPSHLKAERLV